MSDYEANFEGFEEFDAETDGKAMPLFPIGNYRMKVKGVTIAGGRKDTLAFQLVAEGNDGEMTDGETPIDGSELTYYVWGLPQPGDADRMTKGRVPMTYKEAKVNGLKRFKESSGIDTGSVGAIKEGITSGTWIGEELLVQVEVGEYEGRPTNNIKSVKAVE